MFRDYGAYDLAMLRFVNKRKGILDASKMLFQRGDGTLACFFEAEGLNEIMLKSGLESVKSEYCTIETRNMKRGIVMRRVFLNAIYRKI